MGAYTSRSDFQPNSDEISKAVLLSSLANLDNEERKQAVAVPDYRFGWENIQMAPDFIVGECKQSDTNTLFVAFRWGFSIRDMFALEVAGKDEFCKSYGTVAKDLQGLFHNEIFQKLTCNLPSMGFFQNYKADKIIFSGHGLGGALAHLFLICYMLITREGTKRHVSIAFGSPCFCDNDAKRFCEKTMELSRRMFTLVNGADPVPWLLKGIRMTVPCIPDTEDLPSCLERIELKEMQSKNQSGKPQYGYVGLYCEGKDLIEVNPDVKVASLKAWQCHQIENYVKEFSSHTGRGRFLTSNIMEIGSKPSIQSCTLNIYHGQRNCEGLIAIRGDDLSELKEFHVKPEVGDKWLVEDSCGNGILLKASINRREIYTDQIHISVEIRTCFGSIEADVQIEDAWKNSCVAYALNRAMGRLLLMQQSKVLTESKEYKEAYEALNIAFKPRSFGISVETKRKHFDSMRDLLTEKLETPILDGIFAKFKDVCSFVESAEGIRGKSYVLYSTLLRSCPENLCSVIPGESCISRSSNESRSSYFYCISDNKLGTLNYLAIVRTIYCLLSDTESQNDPENVWYYERKIYEHVRREGPAVKRTQWLPEGILTDIANRAWKMYKIISACELLEGLSMAAFIGPENAGKTTLINSTLGRTVEEEGFTKHTLAATMHNFIDDIFIIDFPGTEAGGERVPLSKVWENYDKVADLCIVVLNFVGDNCQPAAEFPRIARSRMSENVVLIMNKVDCVLHGPRKSKVWDEYSPRQLRDLRQAFAESSGLTPRKVLLSVSRANEELEETTHELLKERGSIVMLKEEITSTIRMFISELKSRERSC